MRGLNIEKKYMFKENPVSQERCQFGGNIDLGVETGVTNNDWKAGIEIHADARDRHANVPQEIPEGITFSTDLKDAFLNPFGQISEETLDLLTDFALKKSKKVNSEDVSTPKSEVF